MKRRSFLEHLTVAGTLSVPLGIPTATQGASRSSLQLNNQEKSLASIQVTVPSCVQVNEPFWIGIRLLTQPFFTNWSPTWNRSRATVNGPFNKSSRGIHYMENVLPTSEISIQIQSDEGFEGPTTYSFREGEGPYQYDRRPVRRLEGFQFSTPGIKYVKVKDPITGITGLSNPIKVEAVKPTKRLFWGNLHCHSIFGDGVRIPEEIYAFAKDESFLDIFSLTDHTEAITKAQWSYFKEVTNDFNEDNRFVTFIGGEWTSPKYGHRNFIYPGEDGPILRSSDPSQDTLPKLFEEARKHKALIIANHTASSGHTTNWDNGHDPEVERLVEIYSIGGINEMMFGMHQFSKSRAKTDEVVGSHAIDGLKRGFRLGMIGTGDDHDGRPGDSLHHLQEQPESYKYLKGPGLMGVWATSLTRKSIFEALWNRHVFGTTNHRTWLQFMINGSLMGSEIRSSGLLSIFLEIAGTTLIERIDFLKEGIVEKTIEPNKMTFQWTFTLPKPSTATWYYIRVKLAEDHIAWASPIWVTPE